MPDTSVELFVDPRPDVFGEPYEALTLELPDDREGPVVATLVRRRADRPTTTAALYIHGFSDYFHQRELAEFHLSRGETFYAIDLRKNGRSLLPHQTPTRMGDVADYYPELDAAVATIEADGHDRIVLNAHSTGGLIGALWLHDAPSRGADLGRVTAVVLNSPFLDVPANWALRTLAPLPFGVLARNRPELVLQQPTRSQYQISIHATERGEWVFNQEWKPVTGGVVRAEWLAAAQRAIARAHSGLDLTMPILVMCSNRSIRAKRWSDDLLRGDAVLNADAVARWSIMLGRHLTCVRVEDGMHDLLLSTPRVRANAYAVMARWLDAYGAGDEVRSATRR
ncbi:MAG TPA: alpha/beta fold hydrolase [Nakamurella sp.]